MTCLHGASATDFGKGRALPCRCRKLTQQNLSLAKRAEELEARSSARKATEAELAAVKKESKLLSAKVAELQQSEETERAALIELAAVKEELQNRVRQVAELTNQLEEAQRAMEQQDARAVTIIQG